MVVDQVHVYRLAVDKTKDDAIVAGHADAPLPTMGTFQRMQMVTWTVQILWRNGLVQVSQHTLDARNVSSVEATSVIPFGGSLQSFVGEPHPFIVMPCVSFVKPRISAGRIATEISSPSRLWAERHRCLLPKLKILIFKLDSF